MFEKLKKRWNIQSSFQVVIILTVFTITLIITVYIKEFIFDLIDITPETHFVIKIPLYILVVLTVYNLLLLFNGFLFGQFRFFWKFEKNFFSIFMFRTKQSPAEKVKN